ncbi:MAG: PocR ligand-binding domain-containing protein [Lachnospiraceae bacterium]|nr:PocR ligand-binding domain-containing protein [Lachnospiraceae bacterium]
MISSFDITKLQSLLRDFYTLTHIRITVFDDSLKELLSYPEEVSDFCKIVRADKEGLSGCRQCDRNACDTALRRRGTYIYRCHAGLTEAVSPIFLGNLIVGYLLFGHVFSYPTHEKGWEVISLSCAKYSLAQDELKRCCFRMPVIPEPYIASAANLLHAVASYLCMERMILLRQNDLPLQLDQYIQSHLTQELSAETICKSLGIGKTYLYELSRQNYGCGIAAHIRRLRIAKAQKLLVEEPELPICAIAEACGFEDYNYFITVFKKQTGTTPRQFRLSPVTSYLDPAKD